MRSEWDLVWLCFCGCVCVNVYVCVCMWRRRVAVVRAGAAQYPYPAPGYSSAAPPPAGQCCAANFIRFCFCRWLQNHTRTTFFFRSSFSAIAVIFSPEGRGCTAKYASRLRFSGAAIDVLLRFFSPAGRTLGASGSLRLFFACASASSSHACRMGFSAIILLWLNVRLSKRQMVLCERAPTPGSLRLASALPTSAWVTPSLILRCLNRSAKASSSRGSVSVSGCRAAAGWPKCAGGACARPPAWWWWFMTWFMAP